MRATKLFLVVLALVGLATAYANAQTFIVARDNCNDQALGPPGPAEWHSNMGAAATVRIKASDHQWYGDWDTVAIEEYMAQNPCPPGMWYEASLCIVPDKGWAAAPINVHVAAMWTENDWVEADGVANWANYNWTLPTQNFAATEMYARDIEDPLVPGTSDPLRAVNWIHPTRGPCTMMGTFLDGSDKSGTYPPPLTPWAPWMNFVNTIGNSQDLSISSADHGNVVCVVLDQPLFQDLLLNPDNKGLVVYDLPPNDFLNKEIRTDDFAGSEPYIVLTCVPEPASLMLLAIGGVGLLLRKKRS